MFDQGCFVVEFHFLRNSVAQRRPTRCQSRAEHRPSLIYLPAANYFDIRGLILTRKIPG